MKNITPRQLVIYIALLSSLLTAVSLTTFTGIHSKSTWPYILIISVVVFSITYLVVHRLIIKYIINRISPIYKTIHNVNISQKNGKQQTISGDIFSEIKTDVINWALNRKNEIAELKQTEKYRKEFLGNVMHELKTPIFNIQGYVLTLLDGGLEDESINRTYLERTEKSINRLISIVEDLESISRLESGELKLEYSNFDLRKLIEESFEIHEMMAKNMKIRLRFDQGYEKPVMVFADRHRMLEAINNLIVNSIKYGKKNGSTLVSFHDMDENLLIEIADDGIGISKDKISRLFERFYRVDKGRSRDQGGTGLGLSIVKHIIEAHQQTVQVRSAPNEGSTFAFTLQKSQTKPLKQGHSGYMSLI